MGQGNFGKRNNFCFRRPEHDSPAVLRKGRDAMRDLHPFRRTSRPVPRRTTSLPRNHKLPWIYRLRPADSDEKTRDVEWARSPQIAVLEAVLFMSEDPIPPRKIVSLLGLANVSEARDLIQRLRDLYEQEGSAFQVEEIAGGFQLLTREELHHWLVRFQSPANELKLSPAGRETLAIIAYRQPITRAEVEAIRGVQCGEVLRMLMEKNLIRISGRDDSLGRPVLYSTTKKFLQLLGLRNVRDLPRWAELQKPKK